MQELGDFLRRTREEKGVTLEEIQDRTKIRRCYLEALETGELQIIPGEVYIRGFLQNYAEAVGLQPRQVLEFYDQLRAAASVPSPAESAVFAPAGEEKVRLMGFPWWQAAVVAGSIILLLALFFLALRNLGAAPAGKPAGIQEREPHASTGQGQASAGEGLWLVLTYTGRCWVSLECDGDKIFEGTVAAGTIQEWRARARIAARFGNAGAVQAELNGKALPPFGALGRSVFKEFTYTNETSRQD